MITPHADRSTSSTDYLRWRDELLQVMYWMAGEGLASQPTAVQIETFLGADRDVIDSTLARMVADGFVSQAGGGTFALTDLGMHEGKRSFADEFSGFTSGGHGGECAPDCQFCHGPDGDPSACPSKQGAHAHAEAD